MTPPDSPEFRSPSGVPQYLPAGGAQNYQPSQNYQPAQHYQADPSPAAHTSLNSLRTPRDAETLFQMIDKATEGDISRELPLVALQELTKQVASFSRKTPPRLVQQKRHFVRGWYEDQMKLRGLGEGCGPGGRMGGDGSPDRRLQQVDPEQLFAEVEARMAAAQRSITQSELADVHVDAIAEQISVLLGGEPPTMMRDRRNLITRWHEQEKRLRSRSPGDHGRRSPSEVLVR